ncbi:uncharacterized protein LOC129583214 isoform X1 [Paramacrobiotus metropolitanus]|uniref:uncharacterized protein LOC129583214 isoform X1 n=2 Tax=Paramacrobiotus metropolitanus TaxID=2943436 RepID=UPI002445C024|nr:uncharacterized protein LOC129583214 isoform X1 [Paramacrobiotus metropolitanus]XP_055330888.1 uncharacterized protein LOC129583214 isoform X1 [Paramacrobiotus metropolitanus]XP_055330889.1 uncharacterized protein LOC129583214 isoform X1 [Paramacrobiotus metropolitanus]
MGTVLEWVRRCACHSSPNEDRQVIIRGIPPGRTYEHVYSRLKNLSSSYGGNIDLRMSGFNPYAIATCSSISYAKRLKHGMHLEDCFGSKLQTSYRPGSSLYREDHPSEVRAYRPSEFGRVYPPVQPSLHPSYTDPCLPSKGRLRFGLSAYPSIPSDSSIQYEAPILPDGMPGLNSAPVDPAPLPPTTRPTKSSINGSNNSHKPPHIVFDARTAAAPTVPTSVLKKGKLSGMQRFILQDQERRLAAELKDLAVSDSNKVESTPTTPPRVSVKTTKDNAPVPELSIAESAPVKHLVDTSDKTATDVYVTNLDVTTDRDVLCAKLMQLLEPVVPISFVSVYLDQLGLAFAHVIVLGKDNVEKLLNFANNTVFGGKRLSASLDDPSLPVPEIVQRSIVEIFKIHKRTRWLIWIWSDTLSWNTM